MLQCLEGGKAVTTREKAEALAADNDACTKTSVLAWWCNICPIGHMVDGDKCCANGLATEAAVKWLNSPENKDYF